MASPEQEHEAASQQVNDLLDTPNLAKAIQTEEFKAFLDHLPIAIVISKLIRDDQRIVYSNKAFETLTGTAGEDIYGLGWSILEGFKNEDDPTVTMAQALSKWEDH